MRSRHVSVSATTTATPAQVYRVITDWTTVTSWSPMDSCELVEPGAEKTGDGVGEVRKQTKGRVVGFDTTVELVPDRLFRYENTGLPTRSYTGRVELTETVDGCRIDWQADFVPKYPLTGGILSRGIATFLQDAANGLAAYAAKR